MRKKRVKNLREEDSNKFKTKLIRWCIFVVCLTPGIIFAQILPGLSGSLQEIDIADGFTGVGARAMGMGGSHIAVASDYSAIYWNPAQLAYIRRIEISGGLTLNNLKNEATYKGYSTNEDDTHTRLNSLGLVLPIPTSRGGLSFAIGYNRLQNFDYIFRFRYPPEGDRGLERKSGGLYALSIGSGIQVSPIMAAGLNLEVWGGSHNYSWDYENYLPEDENLQEIIYEDNYKYMYTGFCAKLGMTITPHKMLRLGGVITFPAGFTMDEEGTQKTDTLFSSGDEAYYEEYDYVESYKISIPFRFSVGMAFLLPYLTTSVDLTYIDWSQMEYKEPSWALSYNKYIPQNYEPVLKYSVGVETVIPYTMVKLRGGYMNEPLPYTGNEIQKDRQYFTGGVGVLISDLVSLDLATVFGNYEVRDNIASIDEKFKLTEVFLSMAYRF